MKLLKNSAVLQTIQFVDYSLTQATACRCGNLNTVISVLRFVTACDMAQDVGCWTVTEEARVQYEARPCGTCGTKVTFEHFFQQ